MAFTATASFTSIEAAIDDEFFEGPSCLYSTTQGGVTVYGLIGAIQAIAGAAQVYCWELADDAAIDGADIYEPCDLGPACPGPILVSYAGAGLYTAEPYEFWDC